MILTFLSLQRYIYGAVTANDIIYRFIDDIYNVYAIRYIL